MSISKQNVRTRLSWLLYLTPLVAIGPVSTDLYLPSMPEIGFRLSAPLTAVQATLSSFMAGFALSQLVIGPLSDYFGRRPVIVFGMVLYLLASFVCVFAPNVEILIAARFFQAFGSCAGTVLGRAIVRDIYSPKESLAVLGTLGAAMALAPALSPIIGSWLLDFFGWRSNFLAMVIFAAGLLGATLLTYDETNKFRGQSSINPKGIAINFWTLLQNRTFRGYGFTMAIIFGGLFSFISGASIVLINDMGMTPKGFGYAFSLMVIGYALGSASVGRLNRVYSGKSVVGIGTLIACISGAVMAGLAWGGVHTIWAVLLPNGFYSLGVGMTMPTCMAASIGPFPRLAGSAASLIGFMQGLFAVISGWLVSLLYSHDPRALGTSVFVFGFASFLMYWFQARHVHDNLSTED